MAGKEQDELMMMLGRIIATQDAIMRNQDALVQVVEKHVERDEKNFEQVRQSIKDVEDNLDSRMVAAEAQLNRYAGMGALLAVVAGSVWAFFFSRATGT